jgi:hypothetical protein
MNSSTRSGWSKAIKRQAGCCILWNGAYNNALLANQIIPPAKVLRAVVVLQTKSPTQQACRAMGVAACEHIPSSFQPGSKARRRGRHWGE